MEEAPGKAYEKCLVCPLKRNTLYSRLFLLPNITPACSKRVQ